MTPQIPSRVSLVQQDGVVSVVLEGTVDALLVQELLGVVKQSLEGEGAVRLDCAALERLDAATLQVLLALRKTLEARHRSLEIAELSDSVRSFISIAGAGPRLLVRSALPDDTEIQGE
jgi:anti-anti-sigma factor